MHIEKFIPESYKNDLILLMGDDYFPWYYNEMTLSDKDHDMFYQFTHNVYGEDKIKSETFYRVQPILYFFEQGSGLKIKRICRIKVNLLPRQPISEGQEKKAMHTDVDYETNRESTKNFMSIIYYVIDSDGDTVICDNDGNKLKRVSPKAGDCVWFRSDMPHYPEVPKTHKRRIIVNIIVEIEG